MGGGKPGTAWGAGGVQLSLCSKATVTFGSQNLYNQSFKAKD